MRYRKSCEIDCNTPNKCCPEYTPDFVKMAESYGAKGIRVTKAQDIETALMAAKENKKTPTIIEVFGVSVIDYDGQTVLLECTQTEKKNNDLIVLLERKFINRVEIVRGGSVAIEAVSISER